MPPRSLAPAAMVVLWSSGFVGAELGARAGAVPLTLLAWRFVVLALLLVVVRACLGRPWPGWAPWRRQTALGLLCQVVYLGLIFEGVSLGVPSGTSALVAALQPLLVAAVAGPLLGEHPTRATWLGLLVGLIGVALVVGGDLGAGAVPMWAYALPVVATVSLAGGTVLERRSRPPEDLLDSITMQAVVVAVTLMGLAVATGHAAPPADPGFWGTALWPVLLSSLGGYAMYVHLTRTRGATVVSTLLYLTPPTVMLWVWVMFGDPVTTYGVLGLLVSGAGVALVLARGRAATHPGLVCEPPEELAGAHD